MKTYKTCLPSANPFPHSHTFFSKLKWVPRGLTPTLYDRCSCSCQLDFLTTCHGGNKPKPCQHRTQEPLDEVCRVNGLDGPCLWPHMLHLQHLVSGTCTHPCHLGITRWRWHGKREWSYIRFKLSCKDFTSVSSKSFWGVEAPTS